jgi:uncharacterized protein with von Willebrand factor type A (vWA) domain
MTAAASDTGRLADNIAYFARTLRAAGLAAGPAAVVEAIRSVEVAGVGKDDLYWALHANFVTRREQHPVFDAVFRLFWRNYDMAEHGAVIPMDHRRCGARSRNGRGARRGGDGGQPPAEDPIASGRLDARLMTSDDEVFRRRDFEQMTTEEIEAGGGSRRSVSPVTARTRRFRPASHVSMRGGRFGRRCAPAAS